MSTMKLNILKILTRMRKFMLQYLVVNTQHLNMLVRLATDFIVLIVTYSCHLEVNFSNNIWYSWYTPSFQTHAVIWQCAYLFITTSTAGGTHYKNSDFGGGTPPETADAFIRAAFKKCWYSVRTYGRYNWQKGSAFTRCLFAVFLSFDYHSIKAW